MLNGPAYTSHVVTDFDSLRNDSQVFKVLVRSRRGKSQLAISGFPTKQAFPGRPEGSMAVSTY